MGFWVNYLTVGDSDGIIRYPRTVDRSAATAEFLGLGGAALRKLNPTQIIAIGFPVIMLVGTILLMLPISSAEHVMTSPLVAAFTSVSATCVTGLVVVDTGTYFSTFGHVVILLLIQIGALGFMSFAVILSMLIRRRVTPRERMLIAQSYGLNSLEHITDLVKRIVAGTLLFELIGALILATQFVPIFGWGRGLWYGVFHSVTAFCNAGFDILGAYGGAFSSLSSFADNPVVCLTVIFLILIGGIGFLVWTDVINFLRLRRRFSVYSRFVFFLSAVLLLGGAICFLLFEWSNPATFGDMPLGEKLLSALFQSMTLRTAGFSAVDNAALTDPSKLLGVLLMFVGGASCSTAGGVKLVTVGVVIIAVVRTMAGHREINLFGRRLTPEQFMRAAVLVFVQFAVILLGTIVLIAHGGASPMAALYEVTSAAGTVGISMGLTPALGMLEQIMLMMIMYFGRVGILTVTYAVARGQSSAQNCVTYPDANLLIG